MPVHDPNTILGTVRAVLGLNKSYAVGELRKAVVGGLAAAAPLVFVDLGDGHLSLDEASGVAAAFVAGAFAVFRIKNATPPASDAPAPVADAPAPPAV